MEPYISVDLSLDIPEYSAKVFVSTNEKHFVDSINRVGLNFLEDHEIFCVFIDLAKDVESVKDYNKILDHVDPERRSGRILRQSLWLKYIGDLEATLENLFLNYRLVNL